MNITQVPLTTCMREIDVLARHHWEEIASLETGPLVISWDVFREKDERGELVCIVARNDDNEITGYLIGFITNALHYSTTVMGVTDALYVTPDARGGRLGLKLLREAEKVFIAKGTDFWIAHSKVMVDISPLLLRAGFEQHEVTYMKNLRLEP